MEPSPVTAGALPWYKSPVYIFAAGVVLAALGNLFPKAKRLVEQAGFSSTEDVLQFIAAIVTLVSGVAIAVLRWWAKVQPLVWTRKQALEHPATVAVVETQKAMQQAGIPTAVTLQAQIQSTIQPENSK
jgi:hypothetical protein